MAIRYGASALGLVSDMPSGSGIISEDLIAQIAAVVPPSVSSFLLTSKQDTASIIAQQRRLGTNTIQICDRLQSGSHKDLHGAMPGVAIVQVIHITGDESIEETHRCRTALQSLEVHGRGGGLGFGASGDGGAPSYDLWTPLQSLRNRYCAADSPRFDGGNRWRPGSGWILLRR